MSGERIIHLINRPYAIDENACLRYGEGWQKALIPCEPIPDKDMCIGRIDNPILKTRRLMIADYDRKIIKVTALATDKIIELSYPGKSTFVLLEPNACDKMFIRDTVKNAFKKDADRRDHVHVASVAQIERAGWLAFYAPLQMDRLFDHVRLVSKRTIATGQDPTEEDAEKLKGVFTLIPNLHG